MDLRRPTRLTAALVAAAALLVATPVLAVPISGDGMPWGAFSWLERAWVRIEATIAGWTAPSGDPGSFRSISAANGEGIDPNGAPASSAPTTDMTSGPWGGTSTNGKYVDPDG